MRLGKRERRALKELRRLDRAAELRGKACIGQAPIAGSLCTRDGRSYRFPAAGTSKPGAVLFTGKTPYSVDKPSRIISIEGKRVGNKVVSRGFKRFANV